MLKIPRQLDPYRVLHPMANDLGDEGNAYLILPIRKPPQREPTVLYVIASNGMGWDHVSVSLQHRCPTWGELEYIKRMLFAPEDTVMQLHVPVADHINCHPFCLHLWRPQHCEIPRPPSVLVAPQGDGK